jgi:hypothetical protein
MMSRIFNAILLTVIACMLCLGGAGLFWFRARASVAEARESQVDRAIELNRDQFITLETTDLIPLDAPLPGGDNVLAQQSPADLSNPVNQAAPGESVPPPTVGGQPAPSSYELVLKAVLLTEQSHQQRIDAAMSALRTATTDEERTAARAGLRAVLSQVFAADMQAREEQARQIEARLRALRGQYQAREQVKDQIIDLQLKVLEQEAAGLGFPAAALDDNPAEGSIRSREPRYDPPPKRTFERALSGVVLAVTDEGLVEVSIGQRDGLKIGDTLGVFRPVADVPPTLQLGLLTVIRVEAERAVARAKEERLHAQIEVGDRVTTGLEAFAREVAPKTDVPTPQSSQLDHQSTELDDEFLEFLKKYSTGPQTKAGELAARGHIVPSPAGGSYAYVESDGADIPAGMAEIRVCDARTGRRIAAIQVAVPVGKLRFTNEGVSTEEPDGTLKQRIDLSAIDDYRDLVEAFGPANSDEGAATLQSLAGDWRLVSLYQPHGQEEEPPPHHEVYTFTPEGFSLVRNGQPAGSGTLKLNTQVTPPRLLLRFADEAGETGGQIDAAFEMQPDGELWLSVADTSVRPSREAVFAGQPRVIWKLRRVEAPTEEGPAAP